MALAFLKTLLESNTTPIYNYLVGMFKVVDNYTNNGTQLSANTGLDYDKIRRLIYSAITPFNSDSPGIAIFNEEYEHQGFLPFYSLQGFAYNHIDDQFIIWRHGGASASLQTYNRDGSTYSSQQNIDPFGNGKSSGSVCYDYVDDRLLFASDNAGDIKIFKRNGFNWEFERNLGAVNPQEGIAFDENTNTYWYNRPTELVNISKQGVEIRTVPQITETEAVNEGLAWNPHKNTIYVNSDKGYHGGVPDGNRCIELWPDFYK